MSKLVILPGWGQGEVGWQEIGAQLAEVVPLTVLEPPGFGATPLVSPNWGIPDYVDWAMEKLRDEQGVILLGHSFGGRVAALLASRNPKWLKLLILYGAPVLYRPRLSTRTQILLAKLVKPLIPKTQRQRLYAGELRESQQTGMERIFRQAVTFDQTPYLPKIRVPVHLVWGEHDEAAQLAIAREAAQLIPECSLHILPKLGHNAHIENPGLFYGTIKQILTANK